MTNREWLLSVSEYDTLLAAQKTLVSNSPRCVLRLLCEPHKIVKCPMTWEEYKCNDTKKCEHCIGAWLNAERK